MQVYRRGDRGPAVAQIRASLALLGLLPDGDILGGPDHSDVEATEFDLACDRAVRAFQQLRGLTVDGRVGSETFHALEEARWRLGDRLLSHSVSHQMVGDDVAALQERLLELGFDAGRLDGHFGPRTEAGLRKFQREYGLVPDGACGPATFRALAQLRRSVRGGRPHALREAEQLHRAGPALVGKKIVVDPGHGGADRGRTGHDGLREADVVAALASRIEGRLLAAGVEAYLTHGPDDCPTDAERAAFANSAGADLLLSLHCDGQDSPHARGVSTYYYGSATSAANHSMVGEQLAGLVQREIVARTPFLDCRPHAKSWPLLRRTRMPAVQIDLGYVSHPGGRRGAARGGRAGPGRRRDPRRAAAAVPAGGPGPADRHAAPGRPRRCRPASLRDGRRSAPPGAGQARLGRHRAEQALQRHLDVLAPGDRGLHLQPQPGEAVVRSDGLEADREQVLGGDHARRLGSQARSPKASTALMPRRVRSFTTLCTSIRPSPPSANSGSTCAVISSTASAETGLVGKAEPRGT